MPFADLGDLGEADSLTVASHYLITSFYRVDKVNEFAVGVQLFRFIMSPPSRTTIDMAGCA